MSDFNKSLSQRKSNVLFATAATLLFSAFLFQIWYHATRTSATIDEGAHILAGHRHLQCLDFGINPEHPPLLKMIAAAPLSFFNWNEPGWECGSRPTPKPEMFSAGTSFIVQNGIDPIVVPTRLAASSAALVLAALIFMAAWEMFGRAEALTALAIVAFEPSLIGIGSLVMTDMALTATAFAAVYTLYRFRKKTSAARFLDAGLVLGLMIGAKHSAVIFLPVLFALMIADAMIYRGVETGRVKEIARQGAVFAGMILIGFSILWALYAFRYSSIPNAGNSNISVADYIKENGRPEMVTSLPAKATDVINRIGLLPEAYVLGMADVIAWGSRNSFLFGRSYPTGRWFYFPVAFAVKSSIALLFLLPFGLLLPLIDRSKRREMMFVLVPPIAYFAFAMTSPMTIGIRHLLPVYGFFIVAAAAGAVWAARRTDAFKYVLGALLVYHALTAFRVAPHYLAFGNDLWGGTGKMRFIFNDSNVDFGQNVKLIADYIDRNDVKECWIAPYNHAELIEAMTPCWVLPSGLRVLVSQNVIEPVPAVIEGTVFISVNEFRPRGGDEYMPIRLSGEPVDVIGGGTMVYRGRFEVPLAAAMSYAYRSAQLLRSKRTDEAVTDGRRAVELGGDDPRTHLALGLALVRAGQKEEAARELEFAAASAARDPVYRNAEVRALLELERLRASEAGSR